MDSSAQTGLLNRKKKKKKSLSQAGLELFLKNIQKQK